ncbi:hypothetical protein [Desulfosporosinus sp.]|uniref:hypothetical protein n=1 Tax=Desulfosporosinus sp. TaxID=157907 RepID=UPI0025BC4B8D|nr:hypothetical protein [Desulfosporosinus sp.]MBC2724007.1 hypothetical protein [Desulfosporosinus sp.]MBC2727844.1 hypothetical protein [Desulfosporosinus sp.]
MPHGPRETSDGHGWPSVPVAMDGEKGPVSRPALCKRIKAEFGYDSRRGVRSV